MLDGGSVLREGPLTSLLGTDTVEIELFDRHDEVVAALRQRGASVVAGEHTLTVRLDGDDSYDAIRDAVASVGAGIRKMGTRGQTLEEIFLRSEQEAAR